jgi:hypothetical protein
MATLVGQQLKDTYDSLLKTSDNDALGGTYKEITDGSGNGSNLYLGTGGRVGIGTNSPSKDLTINSATGGQLQFKYDTQDYLRIEADSGGGSYYAAAGLYHRFFTSGSERLLIGSGGDISFRDTGGSEAFYWDASAGSLGIGTTSPDSFLPNGRELVLGDGSASHGMTIFSDSAGTGNLFFADGTTGDQAYRGFLRYAHSSDSMEFYTAGAILRMSIDSSGNVGIGTTSPTEKLAVQSAFTTSASDVFLEINSGHKASGGSDVTGEAGVLFKQGGNGDVLRNAGAIISGREGNYSADSVADSYLAFETAINGTNTEAMRIDSSGNVGIGETNPLHKMEIKSTSDSSDISLKRSQSVLAGGEVLGTIFFSSDDSNLNGSTFPYEIAKIDATSHAGSSGSVGTDLRFFTNLDASTTMTERMRINNEGHVGIGETNPSAKLEITGTDTEPLTVLNNTVYTFAGNATTSQSNTHTVTIPFTSQGSQNSIFMVEIYTSLSYTAQATVYAGRALYALRTLTSISNITELEDNGQNLSFSATSSGMDLIVTITTTATAGNEPNKIGVMAKIIRSNGSVSNEPTSMTIA